MANVHLTTTRPTTTVELPVDEALWLADQLDRFDDPADTPAAAAAADRIRHATDDPADQEVALSDAELDVIRRVLELEPEASEAPGPVADLRSELESWL